MHACTRRYCHTLPPAPGQAFLRTRDCAAPSGPVRKREKKREGERKRKKERKKERNSEREIKVRERESERDKSESEREPFLINPSIFSLMVNLTSSLSPSHQISLPFFSLLPSSLSSLLLSPSFFSLLSSSLSFPRPPVTPAHIALPYAACQS